jgi:hypothetical protein
VVQVGTKFSSVRSRSVGWAKGIRRVRMNGGLTVSSRESTRPNASVAWFADCFGPDWPLILLHAAAGDVIQVDAVLGTHRLHDHGSWTGIPISRRVDLLRMAREQLWLRFGTPAAERIRWLRARSLVAVAMGGQSRREGLTCLAEALRVWPAVIGTRGFWYGIARLTLGNQMAIMATRRILSGLRDSESLGARE